MRTAPLHALPSSLLALASAFLGCSSADPGGGSASSSQASTAAAPPACVVSLGALTIGAGGAVQASVAAASVTAGARTTLGGDVSSSGSVVLGAQSTILGTLTYGGTLTEGSGDSLAATVHAGVGKPTIPVLAPIAGSSAIAVPANGARTIAPGSYGAITVGAGAHVTFAAGTIAAASLTVGAGATVTFDTSSGGVLLEVKGVVTWADGTVIASDPTRVTLYSSGASVTLASGLTFPGSIVAPSAAVSLGADSSVTQGCVQGATVTLGAGVSITGSRNPCLGLADGAPVPFDTACGAGLVCDGRGACVASTRSCEQVAWSQVVGSPGNDSTTGIAVDAQGGVYLVGETAGLDGVASAGAMAAVLKFDGAGNRVWTRQFGASGGDAAMGVATAGGLVYVAGLTDGSLGASPSAGGLDAFLAQYDTAGNLVWLQQFGSAGDDLALGVAVDAAGNAYVAGTTNGSLDGSPSTGFNSLFVVQFDVNGDRGWTRQLGTGTSNLQTQGIAADGAGNVFVTGYTSGGSFDGHAPIGQGDFFLVSLDSAGNERWSVLDGSTASDFAHGVATDEVGNAYVAGFTTGDLDGNLASAGGDFFLVKYDPNGNRLWARERAPASGVAEGLAVASDHLGSVFVTGEVSGSLDGNPFGGSDDWFVSKYTTDGAWVSSDQSDLPSDDLGLALAWDSSSGHLYLGAVSPQPIMNHQISFDFMVDQLNAGVCPISPPPDPSPPPEL